MSIKKISFGGADLRTLSIETDQPRREPRVWAGGFEVKPAFGHFPLTTLPSPLEVRIQHWTPEGEHNVVLTMRSSVYTPTPSPSPTPTPAPQDKPAPVEPPPVPTPIPTPTLDPAPVRPMEFGIVANFDDDVNVVIDLCHKLGIQWVRLWHEYPREISPARVAYMETLRKAGQKIFLTVTPTKWIDKAQGIRFTLGGKSGAASVLAWGIKHRAMLLRLVNIFGVGNEWNFDAYRPADLSGENWHAPHVEYFLKPLRMALPTMLIASCPIADNFTPATYVSEVKLLKAAGAFDVVDYIDLHPYTTGPNVEQTADAVDECIRIAGKPAVSSEHNMYTDAELAEWLEAWPKHIANARKSFRIVFPYRGIRIRPKQKAFVDEKGQPLEPYFSAYKNAISGKVVA